MFKLVQLAVVILPVMYHQCTYLLFQKLFTLSVSHILSVQQINTTLYVLSETMREALPQTIVNSLHKVKDNTT